MPNFDIYSTAAQLKAMEVLPPEYSFLFDTFSQDGGVVEDDTAIYDFRKGSKLMAPVVADEVGGVVMNRDGFETRKLGFATIAPERIITNNDLKGRSFGEEVLGALTPAERDVKMQAQDLIDMRKAIQRRREWMVRKVLFEGKLELFRYTNEGRDKKTTLVANYGFTNTYTATNKWNANGADIEGDMEKLYDLVYDGNGTADVMVMAPDVYAALRANDKYIKTFDLHNAKFGEINAKYAGQGVRFVGYNADGLEMYVCSGSFIDDDGSKVAVVPAGKLLVGQRGALSCIHGPVTQVEGKDRKTYIMKEVPHCLINEETNVIKNRLTSRPTVVPYNVDAWAVATVL